MIGFNTNSLGTFVNDLVGMVGIKGAGIGYAIDSLTGNATGQLANLHDAFLETAMGTGTGPIQRRMGSFMAGGMMPGMHMMSPMAMMPMMSPFCGCGYSGGMQKIDLAAGSTNIPILSKLFSPSRRMAGRFERMLRHNPAARAQFEASIGGRITSFGFRNDGKMTIQRFAPGYMPAGAGMMNPMSAHMFGHMGAMNMGMMSTGLMGGALGGLFGGINPFMGFAAGGFGNMLGMTGMQSPANAGWGPFDNSGALGGRGFGSWNPNAMPGLMQNTNPQYESAHQAQVAGVLADPSLTVEDKVVLMMMLITKKMDRDIERQAQYINSIQQQQSKRGGGAGGKGGKGGGLLGGLTGGIFGGGVFGANNGGGQGNNNPSIDIESMKLKRLVDKRSQMFDILRQIIDKYNQTAKSMIDSIGR